MRQEEDHLSQQRVLGTHPSAKRLTRHLVPFGRSLDLQRYEGRDREHVDIRPRRSPQSTAPVAGKAEHPTRRSRGKNWVAHALAREAKAGVNVLKLKVGVLVQDLLRGHPLG